MTHQHDHDESHSHPHAASSTRAPEEQRHDHEAGVHEHPESGTRSTAHDHEEGDRGHDHERRGIAAVLEGINPFHSHGHPVTTDGVLESSDRGIRAVQISLLVLAATALFQVAVVIASGSVALLADTIHNFTDALTALPLWLAFILGRRATSRRYTYGQGRAEDLAGVFIVLVIFASALVAGYESFTKMMDPTGIDHIGWVMAAAIVGFIGNEAVAIYRIRVGREIGSAALVADGQHAQVDGFTSLAVLLGALGVLAGWDLADPIVGAVITVLILFIVKDSAVMVWHRLMDAVDPKLLQEIETVLDSSLEGHDDIKGVGNLRVRWLGHRLQLELNLVVDADLTTRESHAIAERVRHDLFHAFPHLSSVMVHIDPSGLEHHDLTDHHAPTRPGPR